MKKVIVSSLVVTTCVMMSIAKADMTDIDPKFYLGGEILAAKSKMAGSYKNYQGNVTQLKDKNLVGKPKSLGLGLLGGVQLNEYVALEMGYTHFGKRTKDNQKDAVDRFSVKHKMSNFYADAIGFVPMTDEFKFIGALGFGYLKTGTKADVEFTRTATNQDKERANKLKDELNKDGKTKFGYRIGIGAQYNIDKNIAARLMLRHQKGNKVIKHINTLGLGLTYTFS